MLDCRMSSLSPTTPLSILSECYGIWDHENLATSIVTKLESTDIMDFGEPSMTSPTSILDHCPGGAIEQCHGGPLIPPNISNRSSGGGGDFGGFVNGAQSYFTPMGGDPYSPTDCHLLENFHCLGNMDSSFHKLSDSSTFAENYDNFLPDLLQHQHPPPPHHHHQPPVNIGHGHGGQSSHEVMAPSSSYTTGISNHQEYNPHIWDGLTCEGGGGEYFLRKGTSPTTSESIMSYTDIDSEIESKSSRESLSSAFTEGSRLGSPTKRRVGRPPKKDKKLKRAAEKKTGRLWEFIRDLLKNPDYCPSLVRWENPEEGHFRFVNSEKVAQLWGQIKGNPRMTYEKLSRAMRYYYKSHVFEPVLGRRLVYKFGYNATNWRPVNPNFVQKLY